MRFLPLATLAILLVPTDLRAELDPGLDQPYRLQIILHCADHRLLTPLLRSRLQQEILENLRTELGGRAKIEVVHQHPWLRKILAEGLEAGLQTQDGIDGRQTHFLLVDFRAGQYELETRLYDGFAGRMGPRGMKLLLADRAEIDEKAGRLLADQFLPHGTVTQVKGNEVLVTLQAGKENWNRWIQPGRVFAIQRVLAEGTQLRGRPVPMALLEIQEPAREGVVRCRLWNRYQEDHLRPEPGVAGYRVLLLPTVKHPLQLRFLEEGTGKPLDGLALQILPGGSQEKWELLTNREGFAQTRQPVPHWALVRVLAGDQVRAQIPLPLLEPRTMPIRWKGGPEAELYAGWSLRKDQWLSRIYDQVRLAAERSQAMQQSLLHSLARALAVAKEGRPLLQEELQYLAQEHQELLRLAREKKLPLAAGELQEGQQRLEELRDHLQNLSAFLERVEAALKGSQAGPLEGLTQMLERARWLETQAEFGQALAMYGKVLAASPEQAKIRDHVEKLQQQWAVKSPDHAEARAFFFDTWPRLDWQELTPNLPAAQKSLAVLKQAGDRLTAARIALVDRLHAADLKKRLDALQRLDTEDSRSQAGSLAQIAEELRKFHGEVLEFLAKK